MKSILIVVPMRDCLMYLDTENNLTTARENAAHFWNFQFDSVIAEQPEFLRGAEAWPAYPLRTTED